MEDKITIDLVEYNNLICTRIKNLMLIDSLFDNCELDYDNKSLVFHKVENIIKIMYFDRYKTKVFELRRENNINENDN